MMFKCHLLGYYFQTIRCTELQHMASIFLSTEPYPAHDEKPQGYGTTPPNHLLSEQNTCWMIKALFSLEIESKS